MVNQILNSKEYEVLREDQKNCTRMLILMSILWAAVISIILYFIHFRSNTTTAGSISSTIFGFICEIVMILLFVGYDFYCLYSDRVYEPMNIQDGTVVEEVDIQDDSMDDMIRSYTVETVAGKISCKAVSRDIKYTEGDKVIIWNGKGWDKGYYMCLSNA